MVMVRRRSWLVPRGFCVVVRFVTRRHLFVRRRWARLFMSFWRCLVPHGCRVARFFMPFMLRRGLALRFVSLRLTRRIALHFTGRGAFCFVLRTFLPHFAGLVSLRFTRQFLFHFARRAAFCLALRRCLALRMAFASALRRLVLFVRGGRVLSRRLRHVWQCQYAG